MAGNYNQPNEGMAQGKWIWQLGGVQLRWAVTVSDIMLFAGKGGVGFLDAAPRSVLCQQTQPKSTTCVPRFFFKERNAIAERYLFISNIPTKAGPLMQSMPVLVVGGWTALEKPGKAARSPVDFEE